MSRLPERTGMVTTRMTSPMGMKLGLGLYRTMLVPESVRYARQIGATHIVAHMPGRLLRRRSGGRRRGDRGRRMRHRGGRRRAWARRRRGLRESAGGDRQRGNNNRGGEGVLQRHNDVLSLA